MHRENIINIYNLAKLSPLVRHTPPPPPNIAYVGFELAMYGFRRALYILTYKGTQVSRDWYNGCDIASPSVRSLCDVVSTHGGGGGGRMCALLTELKLQNILTAQTYRFLIARECLYKSTCWKVQEKQTRRPPGPFLPKEQPRSSPSDPAFWGHPWDREKLSLYWEVPHLLSLAPYLLSLAPYLLSLALVLIKVSGPYLHVLSLYLWPRTYMYYLWPRTY
jgi:hypothetical protein